MRLARPFGRAGAAGPTARDAGHCEKTSKDRGGMLRASLLLGLATFLSGAVTPAAAGTPSAGTSAAAATAQGQAAQPIVRIEVEPATLELTGPDARAVLLVTGYSADGRAVDLTRDAQFQPTKPALIDLAGGFARGLADGDAALDVSAASHARRIPVRVSGSHAARSIHFENDVLPILSRFGCNSSGCHGKAEGQNGFKLSIFGFDPQADRFALLEEGRGRRVFPAMPDESLVLKKASGGVPHGGGARIQRAGPEYRMLREWIAVGGPAGDPAAPKVAAIRVSPRDRRLPMGARQQLRVIARYSDGRETDVTRHARFQSNHDELVRVDDFGLVTAGENPGEAAVMAAYMGAVDVFRAIVPRESRGGEARPSQPPPRYNFIDALVDAKLEALNIRPSKLCSDEAFLRRACLDVIGTLPTADEVRSFLAEARGDRRARLIDRLLSRREYADYWALKWADLLRVDKQTLGARQAYAYYAWIRDSFAANKPYDRFVREAIAAEGLLPQSAAGYLYKIDASPGKIGSTVSQVFLGVRIECAQCHHHPYDRWSQTDYYGMQAYFAQVAFKPTPQGEFLTALAATPTVNPRTGQAVFAHVLGASNPARPPEGDRRRQLAAWLTAPENPWFARCFVNRMWSHYLGRGIVEPVDDFRRTNPPSNPELLDALAKRFVASRFDVKALVRTITASRTYQLSSEPNESNERDEQNASRALLRPLDAEVLLDAICQATGVGEKFRGVPAGPRAIELWDNQVPNYFLKLFGRPVRVSSCTCERNAEPSVSQVLHVLNSPEIHAKLSSAGGRVAELCERLDDDRALVDELYLTFFARYPSDEERRISVESFKEASSRRRGAEDLAWSLLNTVEFLFNH
jgi:hypothetical protein